MNKIIENKEIKKLINFRRTISCDRCKHNKPTENSSTYCFKHDFYISPFESLEYVCDNIELRKSK